MQNETMKGNEQEFNSDDLDEILEIRMNKIRARRSQNLEDDDDADVTGTPVLTQRLQREATTRAKRAQKMQEAYHRSMGLASYTPQTTSYSRVIKDNGLNHWTLKRK
ncbi:uncharacterized protein LOC124442333 [Xenia sp. Carnegie-2017]|uniref:uncharacterized protein LOC124442333 n=1 Tax=Xenia sp. Carnegie-2017 TaxID=2897299 RepID=UPI001F034DAB|nr:uncharacterized protein LOC124442333 [Xenia sp. Carnegie-2017]